jgi:hypothetical protein
MTDHEHDPDSFEERLKALAQEVGDQIERAAERIDLDDLADRIGMSGDRVREIADFAGQWLNWQFPAHETPREGRATRQAGEPADGPRDRRLGGPHPLDIPTETQGLALSALDSGRWSVAPGSNELVVKEGPGPSDPQGLVGELRARDWIAASGEVTLVGRDALRRWLDRGRPS